MQNLKSVQVLIGQGGHEPTRERIRSIFDTTVVSNGAISQMGRQQSAAISAIATLSTPIDKQIIDQLPGLEIISSFGVGYDHIDVAYAAKKGICVTHTPHVLDDEVADTTIALLLNTVREFYSAEKYLRDGHWDKKGNFPLTSLSMRGRVVGIFGLGRIGQAIARRLQGFDVEIHYHSRNQVADINYQYHATLLELAQAVDTLIVVVPGTPDTHHAINAEILATLGERGVLVNVGRGPVVDENALIKALENQTIAAAGLDVFEHEPKVPQALIDLPNASLFPHVASASQDTRMAMGNLVIDNLVDWFEKGRAISPVPETDHLKNRKA